MVTRGMSIFPEIFVDEDLLDDLPPIVMIMISRNKNDPFVGTSLRKDRHEFSCILVDFVQRTDGQFE